MNFSVSINELIIISLFFITGFNCVLTYFCCSKSLKIYEEDKSESKAINKLRVYDQYLLSKINLVIALFYFVISYLFVNQYSDNGYVFFFSSVMSFILTLITVFMSRLSYCYTCNVLLETKLNEVECLMINFRSLMSVYLPFFVISLVVPTIYLFDLVELYLNIICGCCLLFVLIMWIWLAPRVMVLSYNAKKIEPKSVLGYRLNQLMNAHGVKRYKLYIWNTSKSKEDNAFVSGLFRYYIFISSSLIEDVTLPELETVITHEVGHIKNNHLVKKMIGKIFIIAPLVFIVVGPYFFSFNKGLVYLLPILISVLGIFIGAGVERKYELQADLYVSLYCDGEVFSSALKKITKYELDGENSVDGLFQSHPSTEKRIRKINDSDD